MECPLPVFHPVDQLVEGVRRNQLRKKFSDVEKLSLQKALEIARQSETTEGTSRCMSATPATPGLQGDCGVWVNRNNRSNNVRQPGRSRRSLACGVDKRTTTSRLRHVQRKERLPSMWIQGALRQLLSEQTSERRIRQELDFVKTARW